MEKPRKKLKVSPYLLVLLSFLLIILLGSFLLTLPIARLDGEWGSYIDALFVSTSATCVTGLCSYPGGIAATLTLFGQIVVAVMIQIGGLGFITVLTFIITLFTGKLQFKDRFYLSQAVGSTGFADIVKFVRKILFITMTVEIIGFILGLPVYLTIFNGDVGRAIWNSAFTSISAFNNAGFDLFGADSLIRIASNPIVYNMPTWCYYYLCSYIMVLIIVGGISFLTIIDIFSFRKRRNLKAFTKICLSATAILLLLGFGSFMLTDGIDPSHHITVFDAAFQSVTLRTAGFATFDQSSLSIGGRIISCILMFMGGCPLSTAGGVKITTVLLIVLAVYSYLRGRKVSIFRRTFSNNLVLKATCLIFMTFLVLVSAFGAISAFEIANALANTDNILFEIFSAFGTVGVTMGITPTLAIGSKIIIILLMFLGRLGPMTFFQIFEVNLSKNSDKHYDYVEEDILIG